jgi:hypothetical protein
MNALEKSRPPIDPPAADRPRPATRRSGLEPLAPTLDDPARARVERVVVAG